MIHEATAADAGEIAVVIGEVGAYYGADYAPADVEQVQEALFGPRPAATVLLARQGGQVVGMASYTFLWPAGGASTSLYLKELFVRDAGRRQGVATALMARLREIATRTGCSRVDWTTDRDNASAVAFYQAMGFEPLESKLFYRWGTHAD